jgi:tetratricopeptide (TPR) repeat protein
MNDHKYMKSDLYIGNPFFRMRHIKSMLYFLASAILILLLLFMNCSRNAETERMEIHDDLLTYHRPISTSSELAQKYFDQGLALYYGFNHEAAIKSFSVAGSIDSTCTMAWWGKAIAAGPNINNPYMDSTASHFAYNAVQKALALSENASPVEQDLVKALSERYAWPIPETRSHLDTAYARAMQEVWEKYPDDADVGALYAEARMDLRPWDLWKSNGTPQPGTQEIVSIIETVLEKSSDHPGACHFYIHTMEASQTPEKAERAADILRTRVPGAGHLVHMPGHIDIRTGKYHGAIQANQSAIIADSAWIDEGGFYTLYRAHNYHFLAYAAMFDGQKALALKAARDMVEQVPMELVRAYPDFLDGFIAAPIHVMVRFGMWEELINEPKPDPDLIATTAFWHYGRTVAFAATDRVEEAKKEFKLLKSTYQDVPESRMIGNNSTRIILEVGIPMAEGELEYRRGNYDVAFRLLETAVARDDSLRYDEPWGWMMPVRHSLGALLLEQGHVEKAEQVYRKDLEIHPENGWALKGLIECLQRRGKLQEAEQLQDAFDRSWARSDIRIKASCFCRTEV